MLSHKLYDEIAGDYFGDYIAQNPTMTIPSAIYSLIMFGTSTVIIIVANKVRKSSV